jgi:hypothetical protein
MNTDAQSIIQLLDAFNARANAATHELKCRPRFYEHIESGKKLFEIRYNDRNYQVGDTLFIREFEPYDGTYSGRECRKKITYITDWEQPPGYVVMGLAPSRANEAIAELVKLANSVVEIEPNQHDKRCACIHCSARETLARTLAILKGE